LIEEISSIKLLEVKEPHKVLEEKRGGDAAKNILLINMLRHAGLEAHPILISTKNKGEFREDWPHLQQFNHVIVHLTIGSNVYWLDTDGNHYPFGMLPSNDLNNMGLIVYEDGGEIIDIPMPKKTSDLVVNTRAILNDLGDVSCHTELRYESYRNVGVRNSLSEEKEEDFVEGMIKDRFGSVVIDSFKVEGLDDVEKPLVISIDYNLPGFAQVLGDMIYVTPPILRRRDSNPFTKEERKYPIEYRYSMSTVEEIKISIPEGWKVVEMPKTVNISLRGLNFTSRCQDGMDGLKYHKRYKRTRLVFQPSFYKDIQNFHAQMIESYNGQIVLGR